jgi:bifunctional DNA-binding transcriptional regulator/antitoxin component of YhaV-PrlF toxin-antitoxin module
MSITLKVDAGGAVTVPPELCRAAGAGPGSELVVETEAGRIVLNRPQLTLGERIAAHARALPPDVQALFPTDGAAQLDHYLYGTPKRPE